MEPNSFNNNSTPISPSQTPIPTPPKKKWPLSRKVTIITAVILIAVLAVIAIVIFTKDSSKPTTGKAAENQPKKSELALISKPDGEIVQYNGTNIIQACSVVTLEDIATAGLRVTPNPLLGSTERVYFDGLSQAKLPAPSEYSLSTSERDENSCSYGIGENDEILLSVYQPAYASKKAVDSEISNRYKAATDIHGIAVYESEPKSDYPDLATYIFRGAGFDVKMFAKTANKEAVARLTEMAAKRLSESANGTSIQQFSYQSPLFKGESVNPCALLKNPDDFKQITGLEVGPLVRELVATAIATTPPLEESSDTSPYIHTVRECQRRTADKSAVATSLSVNADTYTDEASAKAIFDFERNNPKSLTKNLEKTPSVIGDESFFADTSAQKNSLVFRKGRVIIHLSYYSDKDNQVDTAQERIKKLQPFAESIANTRLKNF